MSKRSLVEEETIESLEKGPNKRPRNTSTSSSEESDDDFSDAESEDDATSETGVLLDEWKIEGTKRAPFPFLPKSGLTFKGPEQKDCTFYLDKLIDDEFVSVMVDQTNKHGRRFFDKNPPLNPRSRWVDTDLHEMRVFISVLILQKIIKKPSHELYFTKRESLETPFFNKIMSAKRFQLLVKFLQFTHPVLASTVFQRKTHKIDSFLKYLRAKFKALYVPEKEMTVDGSEGSRCGRFHMLRECKSGYISDFLIRTNRDAAWGSNYPEEKGANRVVLELCHDFLHQGYTLYLDESYASVDLSEKLCRRKTDVVGIIRKDVRETPSDITHQVLKKSEHIVRYKDKLMIMKWKDKRDVIFLSTIHDDNFEEVEKRKEMIRKPEVVVDYFKNTRGGDLAGEQDYKTVRSQIKKNYYKIFLQSLDMICVNAYVLYKKDGGHLDKLHFLVEIVEKYGTQPSPNIGHSLTQKPSRFAERHFADYIPSNSTRVNVTRRCKLCYSKRLRRESRFWCPDCSVPLCMPNCFREYHTEE